MPSKFKSRYWILIIGSICALAVLAYVGLSYQQDITPVKVGDKVFQARLAISQAEQVKGLAGASPLKGSQAMLFVGSTAAQQPIWMKDVSFPLDALWLNNEKEIIYMEHSLSPDSYPQTYGPDQVSRYVLELPTGAARQRNLEVGDRLEFAVPKTGQL